jgi:hypothetical protein
MNLPFNGIHTASGAGSLLQGELLLDVLVVAGAELVVAQATAPHRLSYHALLNIE